MWGGWDDDEEDNVDWLNRPINLHGFGVGGLGGDRFGRPPGFGEIPTIQLHDFSEEGLSAKMQEIQEQPTDRQKQLAQQASLDKATQAIDDLNQFLKEERERDLGQEHMLHGEGAMLQGNEARSAQETYRKVREKYQDKLEEMGGVDRVLNELENVIVEKLGGDGTYLTTRDKRACKDSDFLANRNQNNNLNEVGKYKAALRALMDDAPGSHFGNVLHRGCTRRIGVGFGGGENVGREVLAYMYLAATDPEMDLLPGIEDSMGRRAAVEGELENLINTLADIRRAHNDGEYKDYDSLQDDPSCDAGTWGRIFETPLYNRLTNTKYSESGEQDLVSKAAGYEGQINSSIIKFFNKLPKAQQLELVNNFNAIQINGDKAETRIGYKPNDFYNDIRSQFETFWSDLSGEDEDLKQIQEGILQNSPRGWREQQEGGSSKYKRYRNAFNAHKNYAFHLWCQELNNLVLGVIHENAYGVMAKNVLIENLEDPKQKALAILEHLGKDLKRELEETKQEMQALKEEYDKIANKSPQNLNEAQVQKQALLDLNKRYTELQANKRDCQEKIDRIARREITKNFIDSLPEYIKEFMKDTPAEVFKELAPESNLDAPLVNISEDIDLAADIEPLNLEPADSKIDKGKEKLEDEQETLEFNPGLEKAILMQFDNKINPPSEDIPKMEPLEAAQALANRFKGMVKLNKKPLDKVGIEMLVDHILEKKGYKAKPEAKEEPKPEFQFNAGLEGIILSQFDNKINPPSEEMDKMQPLEAAQALADRFKGMIKLNDKPLDAQGVELLVEYILDKKGFKAGPAPSDVEDKIEDKSELDADLPSLHMPADLQEANLQTTEPSSQIQYIIHHNAKLAYQDWNVIDGEKNLHNIYAKAIHDYEFYQETTLSESEKNWFFQLNQKLEAEIDKIYSKVDYSERELAFIECIKQAYETPMALRSIQTFYAKAAQLADESIRPSSDAEHEHFGQLTEKIIFQLSAQKRFNALNFDEGYMRLAQAAKSGSVEAAKELLLRSKYSRFEFPKPDYILAAKERLLIEGLEHFINSERALLQDAAEDNGYLKALQHLEDIKNLLAKGEYTEYQIDAHINKLTDYIKDSFQKNADDKIEIQDNLMFIRCAEMLLNADFPESHPDSEINKFTAKIYKNIHLQLKAKLLTSVEPIEVTKALNNLSSNLDGELKEQAQKALSNIIKDKLELYNKLSTVSEIKFANVVNMEKASQHLCCAACCGSAKAKIIAIENAIFGNNPQALANYHTIFEEEYLDPDTALTKAQEIAYASEDMEVFEQFQNLEEKVEEHKRKLEKIETTLKEKSDEFNASVEAVSIPATNYKQEPIDEIFLDMVAFVYENYPACCYATKRIIEKSPQNIELVAFEILKGNYDPLKFEDEQPPLEKLQELKPAQERLSSFQVAEIKDRYQNEDEICTNATLATVFLKGAQKRLTPEGAENKASEWRIGMRYLENAIEFQPEGIESTVKKVQANIVSRTMDELRTLKTEPANSSAVQASAIKYGGLIKDLQTLGNQHAVLIMAECSFLNSSKLAGIENQEVNELVCQPLALHVENIYGQDKLFKDVLELRDSPAYREKATKLVEDIGEKMYEEALKDDIPKITKNSYLRIACQAGHKKAMLETMKEMVQAYQHNQEISLINNRAEWLNIDERPITLSKLHQFTKDLLSEADDENDLKEIDKLFGQKYLEEANRMLAEAHTQVDKDVQTNLLKQAIALFKKAETTGCEINTDFVMNRDFKLQLENLSVNPEWLIDLNADMEDLDENIKLDMGVVLDNIQIHRDNEIKSKIATYLNTYSVPEGEKSFEVLIKEFELAEKAYFDCQQQQHTAEELDAKVQDLMAKKQSIEARLQHMEENFKIPGLELEERDNYLIHNIIYNVEDFDTLVGVNQKNALFLKTLQSSVETANYIQEKHNNKQDPIFTAHAEFSQAISDYVGKIQSLKSTLENVNPRRGSKIRNQLQIIQQAEQDLSQFKAQVEGEQHDSLMLDEKNINWFKRNKGWGLDKLFDGDVDKTRNLIQQLAMDRIDYSEVGFEAEIRGQIWSLQRRLQFLDIGEITQEKIEVLKVHLDNTAIQEPSIAQKRVLNAKYTHLNDNWDASLGEKSTNNLINTSVNQAKVDLQKDIDALKRPNFDKLNDFANQLATKCNQLDHDLQEAAKQNVLKRATRVLRKKANNTCGRIGVGRIFDVRTRTVKQAREEFRAQMTEARRAASASNRQTRPGGLFPMKEARDASLSNLTPDELEQAVKFMNAQSDTSRLRLDERGLKDMLAKGATVEIIDSKHNPLTVQFREIDGENTINVKISENLIKNYVTQQERIEAQRKPEDEGPADDARLSSRSSRGRNQ